MIFAPDFWARNASAARRTFFSIRLSPRMTQTLLSSAKYSASERASAIPPSPSW
jgi:hypothetical protein